MTNLFTDHGLKAVFILHLIVLSLPASRFALVAFPKCSVSSVGRESNQRSGLLLSRSVMSRKQKGVEKEFWVARSSGQCAQPQTGRLLPRYLINDLDPAERAVVEAHLLNCSSCKVGLANLRVISAAIREFGCQNKKAETVNRKV